MLQKLACLDYYKEIKTMINEVSSQLNYNNFKNISLRIILFLITGTWLSFYPQYLLVIHMNTEGFFAYEMFSSGLIGLNSSFYLSMFFVIIVGVYLWGVIPLLIYWQKTKIKSFLFIGLLFLIISLSFHYTLFLKLDAFGNPGRLIWVSSIGFIITLIVVSISSKPIVKNISNWKAGALGIGLSLIIPILSPVVNSDIITMGLQKFKIGGNVPVSIHSTLTDKMILNGTLLLVSPEYLYIRETDKKHENGYTTIKRSNEIYTRIGANL